MKRIPYEIHVKVIFKPFPDEQRRDEAYRKWARAFLSAKLKSSSHSAPAAPQKKFPKKTLRRSSRKVRL